ncbi:MAG: glycosyl hydrolase 53 family protein [Bacteroidaceae bacterium]|nr:glycosyl hydrolase 53 family protein [Bacteroidaceae bacterium]
MKTKSLIGALAFTAMLCIPHISDAQGIGNGIITNDCFWNTVDGTPIYSQGGGIFKFTDPTTGEMAYYWYGAHYKEAELYRNDPTRIHERNNVVGVSCYKSTDLTNWKDMGHVITAKEIAGGSPFVGWFGRMGVAFIEETKQYALFSQHNNSVFIALSDSPTGPFKVHKHIDMKPIIGTSNTGDQTVFTDEDTGKDYLIYSYGRGRHIGYVSEIGVVEDGTIGLKNCVQVYKGEGREGNCMFKYKGKYYLCASNLYGWDSSYAYYLVSDDIYGPYTPVNKMEIMDGCRMDYAHISQTGFFYTLRGTEQETVIFCGDRWADFAGNGLGYNQWVPLSFDSYKPYFNSLSEWRLDHVTGKWSVSKGNNYVLNASFEADRRTVPITVKPRQELLLGWDTEVIKGNKVSLDNPHSPKLNHNNSQEERKEVIGEKSLCISDSIDFERRVSQEIASSPYVTLEDGEYTLSLKFRDNGLFKKLEARVESGGKVQSIDLKDIKSGDKWISARLNVNVSGGSAKVVFYTVGKPMAQCLIDDVALVKKKISNDTSDIDFVKGADISWLTEQESRGQKFFDTTGKERDCIDLLKDYQLNAVRLRVWVNPRGGWCGRDDVLKKALRAHDLGMDVMLCFHYGDWWADPAKQPIPKAWMEMDFKEMKKALAEHTTDVIKLLKANGITPRWVQIGNETSNGMLWNVKTNERGWEIKDENGNTTVTYSMGHIKTHPKQYAGFIRAGYDAVKKISPESIVIVHLDNGFDAKLYDYNLDTVLKYGGKFDMIGMSLYPYWAMDSKKQPDAETTITNCMENIRRVGKKYGKDVMIVETGFEVNEGNPKVMEEGRKQLERIINETHHKTDGRCRGVFYWEPQCMPGTYKLGAFSSKGSPTVIMDGFVER